MRLVVLGLLLLTSCGYRMGDQGCLQNYQTVSVSYVGGDRDGHLTEALVREIDASGALRYVSCNGDLILQVCLVDRGNRNIGYQYDTNDEGERTQRIVPTEGRLTYCAEVTVLEAESCCRLMGPVLIRESVSYDFDPLSTDNELSVFSLGQFTNIEVAEEFAAHPLNERLARKIVDYLTTCW